MKNSMAETIVKKLKVSLFLGVSFVILIFSSVTQAQPQVKGTKPNIIFLAICILDRKGTR